MDFLKEKVFKYLKMEISLKKKKEKLNQFYTCICTKNYNYAYHLHIGPYGWKAYWNRISTSIHLLSSVVLTFSDPEVSVNLRKARNNLLSWNRGCFTSDVSHSELIRLLVI